jgi:uncharacterized protein
VTAVAVGFVLAFAAGEVDAQDEPSLEPQIAASSTADVTIPATTASFSIEIASLAGSAAAASATSARISTAVSNALQAARLSREEIAQTQLLVSPRWSYDEAARKQKRAGYEATTLIQIRTDRLDRLGAYMDAALGAGATGISGIEFSARNAGEARRRALTQAVAQARADAETMARAGGGTLGQLLLLTTERSVSRPVELTAFSAVAGRSTGAEGTNIVPSQIKVTATVVGHWQFVASTDAR